MNTKTKAGQLKIVATLAKELIAIDETLPRRYFRDYFAMCLAEEKGHRGAVTGPHGLTPQEGARLIGVVRLAEHLAGLATPLKVESFIFTQASAFFGESLAINYILRISEAFILSEAHPSDVAKFDYAILNTVQQ